MDATRRTFAVLELLRQVLVWVDFKSLPACARTCRTWNREVLPILWHGWPSEPELSPDASTLEKLTGNPERFKHYLSHIKYLNLYHGHTIQQYSQLWQPELWHGAQYQGLTVDLGSEVMTESHMELLMHGGLAVIELYGGYYSDGFLQMLQTRCAHVRWILIDNRSDMLTSQGLLAFLQHTPSLEAVTLFHGFEVAINEPVLIQLTNLQQLNYLSLGPTPGITGFVVQGSFFKLKNVQYLELDSAIGASMASILHGLSQLEVFTLRVVSSTTDLSLQDHVLLPICSCPNLGVLDVETPQQWTIADEVFNALAQSCKQLRDIRLFVTTRVTLESQDSRIIRLLACKLRHLETLAYNMPCGVFLPDLVALSKGCPVLRALELNTALDVSLLGDMDEEADFPRLESIEAYAITMGRHLSPASSELEKLDAIDSLDTSLRQKAPRLEEVVGLEGTAEHVREMLRIINGRRGPSDDREDDFYRRPAAIRLRRSMLQEALER